MSSKYKRPRYTDMASVIGQCARLNMNRIIFSVLMFYFVFMVILIAGTMPVINAVSGTAAVGSSASILMSIIMGIITILVFMLIYGLNVSVSKVIERENGGFGTLFSAFKSNTLKVFLSSVIFLLLGFVAITVSLIIFSVVYKNDEFLKTMLTSLSVDFINENSDKLFHYVKVLTSFIYGTLFILFFPFVFVWLNIYVNPKQNLLKSFGKSIAMLFGKVFHFIGFVIYASWKPICVFIAATLLSRLLPKNMSFIADFCGFIGFVAEILLISKVILSYTVYYYFLTGNITLSSRVSETEVIEVRDALPGESKEDVVYPTASIPGSKRDNSESDIKDEDSDQ